MKKCKRKCVECNSVDIGYVESIMRDKILIIMFDNFYFPAKKEEILFGKKVEVGSFICRNKENQLKSCKFVLN